MKYVYVNPEGKRISLRVKSSKGGVTVLEDAVTEPVKISASEWVADVLSQIEGTGNLPLTAIEHVLDGYSQRYQGNYVRGPISKKALRDCVVYLESLRAEAIAEQEDSAWTTEAPFTEASVLEMFGTSLAKG